MADTFKKVGAFPNSPRWENCVSRNKPLYSRPDEIRSEFSRDYNRLLHCTAYRRLKPKTQVFFATENDHRRYRCQTYTLDSVKCVRSVAQT